MPVSGLLLDDCHSWHEHHYNVQSLERLERNLLFYGADPEVRGIVFDFKTNGGSGYCKHIFDIVQMVRKEKPVLGAIQTAMSAGYWIASGCDYLIAKNEMSKAGCVGTIWVHVDYSAYYNDKKIKFQVITSEGREAKKRGNMYEELKEEDKQKILEFFAKEDEIFDADIKLGRGENVGDELFSGEYFLASDALQLNAIDTIATNEPEFYYKDVAVRYIDDLVPPQKSTSIYNNLNFNSKMDLRVEFKKASNQEEWDKAAEKRDQTFFISESDAKKISGELKDAELIQKGSEEAFKLQEQNEQKLATLQKQLDASKALNTEIAAERDEYYQKGLKAKIFEAEATTEEENDEGGEGGEGGEGDQGDAEKKKEEQQEPSRQKVAESFYKTLGKKKEEETN